MLIHTTLAPLVTAPEEVKALMNSGEVIGDGGYSRVIAMSDYEVLKVSSCLATIALLKQLEVMTAQDTVPEHLPRVFKSYGTVAMDADGLQFEGFVVERLFDPIDYGLRLRARQALRNSGLDNRYYRMSTLKPEESLRVYEAVVNALKSSCREHYSGEYAGWVESSSLAGFVATDSSHPLEDARSTFTLLEAFVEDTRYELDLETKGNLLVNAVGIPVLADPVAEVAQCVDNPLPTDTVPSHDGVAVVELRPRDIQGFDVRFQWVTLAHADSVWDAGRFVEQRRRAFPHAKSYRLVPWRGEAHRELLEDFSHQCDLLELAAVTQLELKLPAAERHPDLAGLKLPKYARRFLGACFPITLLSSRLNKLFTSCFVPALPSSSIAETLPRLA